MNRRAPALPGAIKRSRTAPAASVSSRMRIDEELKRQLAHHFCAIVDCFDQANVAAWHGITQAEVSALRRGSTFRFSAGRLLRLIAQRHFDIHVQLRQIPRPYARPRRVPELTVERYDRYGRRVTDIT